MAGPSGYARRGCGAPFAPGASSRGVSTRSRKLMTILIARQKRHKGGREWCLFPSSFRPSNPLFSSSSTPLTITGPITVFTTLLLLSPHTTNYPLKLIMQLQLSFLALAAFVGAAAATASLPDTGSVAKGAPAIPSTDSLPKLDSLASLDKVSPLLQSRSGPVQIRASLMQGQNTLSELESQLSSLGSISERSAVSEAQAAVEDAMTEYGSALGAGLKRSTDVKTSLKAAAKKAKVAFAKARKALDSADEEAKSKTHKGAKKTGRTELVKYIDAAEKALDDAEEAFKAAFGTSFDGTTDKRDGLLLNNVDAFADQTNAAKDNPTDETGIELPPLSELLGRDGLLVNNVAVLGHQKNTKGNSNKMELLDLVNAPHVPLAARDGVLGNNVNLGGKQANSRKGSNSKGTLIKSPDLAALLPRAGAILNNINLLGEQTHHREKSSADQKVIGRALTGAVEVADIELIGSDGSLL
ncbi:hypothetical protein BCV69DRAFT_10432 [Microstroma glucosiphilum]|uniref:Uncharacterized protein n=1 Tax=Pseudomicrostroma glucosiphilum TaxID=1684307 RepID=A0A316UEX9_9BASI|nr:hypothetical protein BCV69DRAFT_10432 [Pseudomicrostroma glucosiphilum]PWN23792.1 hypothetical protein BCV69DRAFT_10432 [Pseudomicrostroma glucosiphilum]